MPRRKRNEQEEPVNAAIGDSAADGAVDGAAADPAAETLGALQDRISALEAELADARDQHLRLLAEFQNFRRRKEEEMKHVADFANRELILALLPVVDDLERALEAAEGNKSYEALVGGVALTLRKLHDFLAKHGVEAIEALGQPFDPEFHEAIMRVEDSEHPDNTVVGEMRRGYRMKDRVIRPSMVKVAAS